MRWLHIHRMIKTPGAPTGRHRNARQIGRFNDISTDRRSAFYATSMSPRWGSRKTTGVSELMVAHQGLRPWLMPSGPAGRVRAERSAINHQRSTINDQLLRTCEHSNARSAARMSEWERAPSPEPRASITITMKTSAVPRTIFDTMGAQQAGQGRRRRHPRRRDSPGGTS